MTTDPSRPLASIHASSSRPLQSSQLVKPLTEMSSTVRDPDIGSSAKKPHHPAQSSISAPVDRYERRLGAGENSGKPASKVYASGRGPATDLPEDEQASYVRGGSSRDAHTRVDGNAGSAYFPASRHDESVSQRSMLKAAAAAKLRESAEKRAEEIEMKRWEKQAVEPKVGHSTAASLDRISLASAGA